MKGPHVPPLSGQQGLVPTPAAAQGTMDTMDADLDLREPLIHYQHAQRNRSGDKQAQQDTFWPCAINLSKVSEHC
jgi:hypothetical protein